jgi:hypothetical protein
METCRVTQPGRGGAVRPIALDWATGELSTLGLLPRSSLGRQAAALCHCHNLVAGSCCAHSSPMEYVLARSPAGAVRSARGGGGKEQ